MEVGESRVWVVIQIPNDKMKPISVIQVMRDQSIVDAKQTIAEAFEDETFKWKEEANGRAFYGAIEDSVIHAELHDIL